MLTEARLVAVGRLKASVSTRSHTSAGSIERDDHAKHRNVAQWIVIAGKENEAGPLPLVELW